MELSTFLTLQRELQINMKKANPTQGGDPFEMTAEELAVFITWNHTALCVELGEMMAEVGWKPWADLRWINGEMAIHEMVDAWHFFMNILLGIAAWSKLQGGPLETQFDLAEFFSDYYIEKNKKNLQRQIDGYDGVAGKCGKCKRDLAELPSKLGTIMVEGTEYCSDECAEEARNERQRTV